jgi:signal transduction histidine kinase
MIGTDIERAMRSAAESGEPVAFEAYDPSRGEWTSLHCYPLPDGGVATQWRSITDRKRAEEAAHYLARASDVLGSSLDYETTLRELAQVIVPDLADWCAVDILSEDGVAHQQLAVAHIDPAKVQWVAELNRRYPPNPNAPTGVPEVLRTGKPELYPEIPKELLAAGAVDEEHLRLSLALGLRSAMIVPLQLHGRTLGALTFVSAESGRRYSEADLSLAMELGRRAGMAVDNARRHRAELEARRVAEAASLAKSQFLAVMSHELRTPLNAIGGYAELLRLGIRGPVTPEQDLDLSRIQRSQRNLLSVINDILNFSKLDAGHVVFASGPVLLQEALVDIEAMVLPQLRERGLTYESEGCDPELYALADGEKVRQALANLVSNAIKFTESGGRIIVACEADESSVRVSVRDTGVGIPADKLESIFEPFVQLDRTLASTHQGTGLGLAISRDLARGMGGDLTAFSDGEQGATFTLSLPRAHRR